MSKASTDRTTEFQARLDELSDGIDKLRPAFRPLEPAFDEPCRAITEE